VKSVLKIGCVCGVIISTPCFAEQSSRHFSTGKKLALAHCSRCHVVDPEKPFTGIASTPSFKLMVNELPDWEDRFSSFFVRLPHQSIVRIKDDERGPLVKNLIEPVILEPEDIDALVAYARTLLQ